jgi:hypothetical protein
MRKNDDLDLKARMAAQADRDARPPVVSNAPEHPGDECPCTDCVNSR